MGRDAIKIFIPQPKIKAKKEVDKNGVGNTHNCHRECPSGHHNVLTNVAAESAALGFDVLVAVTKVLLGM